MRAALFVVVLLTGCQCAPPEVVDSDAGGSDAGGSGAGGSDAGGSDAGGDGGSSMADAGVPTALHLQMASSAIAQTCELGAVSSFGIDGVTAVSTDTEVTLDGGRWLEFFDGVDCQGTAANRLTLEAGESTHTFRYRMNAWGELSTEASAPTLAPGTATFTSYAEVSFVDARSVLPAAVCRAISPVRALVPSSDIEVPAAKASVFTLDTAYPVSGGGLDAGCLNLHFEVTMPEGSSRAEVLASTSGRPATVGELFLSPALPPGATLRMTQLALFATCLPPGQDCDGGVEGCCGAACVAGTCPSCRADGEVHTSVLGPANTPRLPCCSGFDLIIACNCEGGTTSVCRAPPAVGSLGTGEKCRANENCASGVCGPTPNFCPPVVCALSGQCAPPADAGP